MKKPFDILLIEDDTDDIDLLREALNENKVSCHLEVITEGDQVCTYLKNTTTLPGIIVMDLNLPKVGGKEILRDLKTSFHFNGIPIVVLTTSSSREDIDYCNKMGIKKFITKPANIEGWNTTVNSIMSVARNLPN